MKLTTNHQWSASPLPLPSRPHIINVLISMHKLIYPSFNRHCTNVMSTRRQEKNKMYIDFKLCFRVGALWIFLGIIIICVYLQKHVAVSCETTMYCFLLVDVWYQQNMHCFLWSFFSFLEWDQMSLQIVYSTRSWTTCLLVYIHMISPCHAISTIK